VDHSYTVGEIYRDRAGIKFEDDEFLRWLNQGKTIANSGGVRWRDFLTLSLVDPETQRRIPAYFVLVTVRHRSQFQNPWKDQITPGRIQYWGDAKLDSTKTRYSDFKGNQRLLAASHAARLGPEVIPPILHFTKVESGWVQFNGLCWLSDIKIQHFSEAGRSIENLLSTLDVLDIDEVPLQWLRNRSAATNLAEINREAPLAWKQACNGTLHLSQHKSLQSYSLAAGRRAIAEGKKSAFDPEFDPKNMDDARAKIMAEIFRRQGQKAFRRRLLEAYGNRCAMTGCEVIPILEACHIRPYKGRHTNHPQNGILLRADLHTLFDQGLIGIEPESMTIEISQDLKGTEYEIFRGHPLRLPIYDRNRPSMEALRQHYLEMNV
jgi:hypothetical protein